MEDRPFFNPYIFNGPFVGSNLPPNIEPPPNTMNNPFLSPELSPKEFYENQYFYYRYLNEFMDYKIKSREYDKQFGNQNNNLTTGKSI